LKTRRKLHVETGAVKFKNWTNEAKTTLKEMEILADAACFSTPCPVPK